MADETQFMIDVMRTLRNNPTSADLDFLIAAHTKVGYLASVAEGEADMAYAIRKHEEATAWKNIMSGENKVSGATAERLAELEIYDLRVAEVQAKEKATKIKNLLQSITEAINGIKYVGRLGG